jgi:hypothetical protein
MPIPIQWMTKAGLGRSKLHSIHMNKREPVAEIHRVYAGKTIESRQEPPPLEVLSEAMTTLFVRGSWEKRWLKEAKSRHRIHSIACMLREDISIPDFQTYIFSQFEAFGLEDAQDVALLSGEDLLPPLEPLYMRDKIEKEFLETFSIGDARYQIEYDVPRKTMRFHQTHGHRKTAPPLSMCPRKSGWKYIWVHKNREFPLS